ncbi:MAG: PAS domain S-box protein [Chlorobi bacterium]|nr:PAS domain S-box protein [Chlorobiota bacterium]
MDKDFEQDFRRHFNLAPLPYQSLDEKGKIISVNPAWLEFFNYEENEVIGKFFSHFLTSVSAKAFNERFSSFISKGFVKDVSLEAANKDGKILTISLNGNVIRNKRGAFHGFQSVLIKVEKQKEIISDINSIINAREEPIWAIDRDYKFLFFNEKFKEAFNKAFEIELTKGISAINIIDDEKQISFWKQKYEPVFSGKPQKFIYAFTAGSKPKYSEITLSPIVEDNTIAAAFAISVDITEKSKMDQKINEQKIWYETVFEGSKDAIFISSEDANFCMVNEAAAQLTGYSKEELLQMSIPDLHEVNDLTAYNNFFGRILDGEDIVSEANILRKDGSKVETEFSNKLIEIGDKKFMHTIARDISERKYFQDQLEKSLNDYKTVFDKSSDAILIFEPENETIFDVNETAIKIYGFSREELIGMDLRNISKTPERGRKIIRQALKEETSLNLTTTHFKKTGEEIFFQVNGFFTTFKGKKAIISFNHDITERVRIERALEESEKYYKLLFESSPVGIYVAKPDGTILDANPKLLEMLGSPSVEKTKEINLLTLPNLIESKYSEAFLNALKTGETAVFDSNYISKWGKEIFLSSIIVPLKNEKNIVEKLFAVIQDRTAERQYLEELKESEKLFRDMFNSSMDIIVISEIESGKYIRVNKGFVEIFGIEESEALGKSGVELGIWKSETQRKEFIEKLQTKKGISNHQISFKLKNGKAITALVSSGIITIKGKEYYLNTGKDITDIIELKEALTETEKLYETLFEKLTDSVVLYDVNGRILNCNSAFIQHLGYQKEEIIGKSPADYTPPEFAEKIPARIKKLLAQGEILFESIHVNKNGKRIPVEVNAKKIKYKGEDAFLAVNRNISARKEAMRKLEESESLFRGVFNNTLDAITISDIDSGEYVRVNKGFSDILGFTEEEALGKTSVELGIWLSENDRRAFLRKFKEDGYLREYIVKLRAKGGEIKTALISSELISLEGKDYFLNTGKDITKLLETQKLLLETEKLYETLFELSPSGIILGDLNGNILDVNQTFSSMVHYSREELIGMNITKLNSSETPERIKANVQKIISAKYYNHEVINIRKDSTEIHLALKEKLIDLPDGTKGILSIAIDITERKRYEAELQKSRKELKRLTNYLQNVREKERGEIARRIHDALGQSLTAVQFETAWLQKNLSDDKIISERLSRLKNTVDEMTVEVRNISAELRPSMLDELGLPTAIEWYCEEFERKSGIEIHKKIEPEELFVDNNLSIHIFRMLQECLTNVWRHSKATRVTIELKERHHSLYLSIRDNGIGLDEKKIHNIKSLGLLGLKERVFALQGQIDFISAPGKGTKIKIVIPLKQKDHGSI